jgi:hypothetical protein
MADATFASPGITADAIDQAQKLAEERRNQLKQAKKEGQ